MKKLLILLSFFLCFSSNYAYKIKIENGSKTYIMNLIIIDTDAFEKIGEFKWIGRSKKFISERLNKLVNGEATDLEEIKSSEFKYYDFDKANFIIFFYPQLYSGIVAPRRRVGEYQVYASAIYKIHNSGKKDVKLILDYTFFADRFSLINKDKDINVELIGRDFIFEKD